MSSKDHVVPLKAYIGVAVTLFCLTAITVAVSFVHLGGFNAIVALIIATTKALLVAFIFMHLLYDKKINLYIFTVGIIFIGIFISFTMFDTLRRSDIYELRGKVVNKDAVIYQQADSTGSPVQEHH